MKITYSSISDTGPRSKNEDSCLTLCVKEDCYIFAVADGLGGMGSGEVASSIAINYLKSNSNKIVDNPIEIKKYIKDINSYIINKQNENNNLKNMATTLTVAVIVKNILYVGHVGDTRIAVARDAGIKRLTKDQSEAQRLLDSGKLTKEEYKSYSRKNILENALGAKKEVKVYFDEFSIKERDFIIITSDGVHNKIFIREVKKIIDSEIYPELIVKKIRDEITLRGPDDNFTCVVCRVDN